MTRCSGCSSGSRPTGRALELSRPDPDASVLEREITHCMLVDQPRFVRRLKKLGRRAHGREKALVRLAEEVAASGRRRHERAVGLPPIDLAPELPVSAQREAIARLIAENQVCIICGATGSGKTTQIPKLCLSMGRGIGGLIGHTQPRRIAARSVAARIAQELNSDLGALVGYKVRFKDRLSPGAYLKLMTDGVLLAEIHSDRLFRQYDTLIIDEAHERSLNIDFLLGYLKHVLPRRPDLKVVITSATIDPERFSSHFDSAPVLEVRGRSFPVEVDYVPVPSGEEDDAQTPHRVAQAIRSLVGERRGDVLVFLSGEQEIRETAAVLKKAKIADSEVLPLYGRLSARAQDRVFAPSPHWKIVLATNVAETSLTVPNIGYVIDSGLARISRYSYRTKLQHLPIESISKASAEQRKGRCGRTGPGTCIRLYSKEAFESWPDHTEPEILRTNLAAVVLKMKVLEIGDIESFPFLDPPDRRYIADGIRLLRELGALDENERLTAEGRRLARLPVDPRVGRMILAAGAEQALREVLVIASALSIQDPLQRPPEGSTAATEAARVRDPRSDFMTYLKVWNLFHDQARGLSGRQLERLCRRCFVSWTRMREWQEVHRQLAEIARELGLERHRKPAGHAQIHRALLAGSIGLVGRWEEGRKYSGARGISFLLSPGSTLSRGHPKWVMAAELVETRRVYAHRAAQIRPEWIARCAPEHLLNRTYSEPYFDAQRGRTMARERITVYGLPVVTNRRVPFDPINPEEARRVLIASGLVEGKLRTRGAFLPHNQGIIEALRALEDRSRRADIVIDEGRIAELYAARIPEGVCTGAGFERWRRAAERHDPEVLFLRLDQLRREDAPRVAKPDYPEFILVNGHRFPLRYCFNPGDEADGITVTVPAALLNQLTAERFDWLVPGLLGERILALLRTLPKSLRRNFVPIPEFAEACLGAIAPGEGRLTQRLVTELERMTGVGVPESAFKLEKLPEHLRMRYELVDADLQIVAWGRDLPALQARYAADGERGFEQLRSTEYEQAGLKEWSFGELPEAVEFDRGAMRIKGYPALIDEGASIALRLLDAPGKAAEATRGGLRRLLELRLARDLKALRRGLPDIDRICLLYAAVASQRLSEAGKGAPDCNALKQEILDCAVNHCFLESAGEVRSRAGFEAWVEAGHPALGPTVSRVCELLLEALECHHRLRLRYAKLPPGGLELSRADIDSQLSRLVYRGFVAATPLRRLEHFPRYLRALRERIEKLVLSPEKDARRMRRLAPLWDRYLRESGGPLEPEHRVALDRIRWMIEELRVAIFAQSIGTVTPTSVERIEAAWPVGEETSRSCA